MKHYLVTRFIYPENYRHMKERIEMFNKYTLPSVKAQNNKNFAWVIIGRPEIDLTGIDHVFIDAASYHKKDIVHALRKFILTQITANEIVITSRLDNDDILLPNFTMNVQFLTRAELPPFLIEFKGFWLDLRVNKFYTNTRYRDKVTSPFLSLVEQSGPHMDLTDIKTVYYDNHANMSRHFPVVRNRNNGWVQIIHKNNLLMNRIKPGNLEGTEINMNDFPYKIGE